MAVTYGFYNSVNGDRKYNAEQMSQIFDGIINDGVFGSVGTMFGVTPSSGMVISVGAGRAWFNHTWTYNDAPITLTVSTAPTGSLKRIDAVVIEVNTNTRVNTIKMINGTVAASPSRPTLTRSGGIYQYAIAYITVAAGVTTITASMIAGVVGTDTPLVTGPLQTASIESLYNQWRGEFEEWFQHLHNELDENQAANLQNQIDSLNSSMQTQIDDLYDTKANTAALNSLQTTVNGHTTSITNLTNSLSNIIGKVVIEKIATSCTWKAPTALNQSFRIYGVGGGGAGGSHTHGGVDYGGGGGGYVNIATKTIAANTSVTVTCGAGGTRTSSSSYTNGGNSTFGSYLTANGGKTATSAAGGAGGAGGGGAGANTYNTAGGAGGAGGTYGGGGGGGGGYNGSGVSYNAGVGGAGGTYGGGGGGGGNPLSATRIAGGAKGTNGGAGGSGGAGTGKTATTLNGNAGSAGSRAIFNVLTDMLLVFSCYSPGVSVGGKGGTTTHTGSSTTTYVVSGGGGGGGYGSVGGAGGNARYVGSGTGTIGYSAGGGGGGGYGGSGGNGSSQSTGMAQSSGGGGGGQYFSKGGSAADATTHAAAGGGGGLFAKGGDGWSDTSSIGSGGGAGISDVEYGANAGTSGGFYVLYYKA